MSERARIVDEMLERFHAIPGEEGDYPEASRRFFERIGEQFPTVPGVTIEVVGVGGVPAELTTPDGAVGESVILYFHGGAFVIGSPRPFRNQSARLSLAAGCQVLTVDYRLAPEHPFPAALDDAVTSYRWLLKQGWDPAQIVLAGDSAGGNLALTTLLRLRDGGDSLPAAGLLISPWVDLTCSAPSMETNADPRQFAQREGLLEDAALYLQGADPCQPLASPLFADLTGLPPLLIQVGSTETLLDDARRLAERATSAGVDVTLEVWQGMPHEWHLLSALLPPERPLVDADLAIEQLAGFAREHLR